VAPLLSLGPQETVAILRAECGSARSLVAPGVARRLDDFSLPALCAALLALQDSGLTLPNPERVGILVATGWGALGSTFAFLDDLVVKGDGLASPIHFAQSVHNAPAFVISSALKVTGPATTLTGFSLAWPRALATALGWLERRLVDLVLLCSADEHHPVVGYALRELGGWAKDGQMRPLDLHAPSYVPGESFTTMVLGPEAELPARWGLDRIAPVRARRRAHALDRASWPRRSPAGRVRAGPATARGAGKSRRGSHVPRARASCC